MHLTTDLIALALGYFVFASATKETGGLRTAGRALGMLVIAFSLFSFVSGVAYKASKCMDGGCPFVSKVCPVKQQ